MTASLELLKICGLAILAIFSLRGVFYTVLNIKYLYDVEKDPSVGIYRRDLVFNKKTGKLESDAKLILPYSSIWGRKDLSRLDKL